MLQQHQQGYNQKEEEEEEEEEEEVMEVFLQWLLFTKYRPDVYDALLHVPR